MTGFYHNCRLKSDTSDIAYETDRLCLERALRFQVTDATCNPTLSHCCSPAASHTHINTVLMWKTLLRRPLVPQTINKAQGDLKKGTAHVMWNAKRKSLHLSGSAPIKFAKAPKNTRLIDSELLNARAEEQSAGTSSLGLVLDSWRALQ